MAGIRIQFFLRTHIHVRIRDHLCMGAWEHGSMRALACTRGRGHVCAHTRPPPDPLFTTPTRAHTGGS